MGYGDMSPVMASPMHDGPYAVNGAGGSEPGTMPSGDWDWQALRRGFRDARGDMAFYDASFVEDPWRHLRSGEEGRTGQHEA